MIFYPAKYKKIASGKIIIPIFLGINLTIYKIYSLDQMYEARYDIVFEIEWVF